jgi:hypothetical protein
MEADKDLEAILWSLDRNAGQFHAPTQSPAIRNSMASI